jgi:nucleoid-associated protein YgaU
LQLSTLREGLETPLNPLVPPQQRGEITYMVGDYETLPTVAAKVYGSPGRWTDLAAANGLEYPYTLTPGQRLTIPNA